MSSRALADFVLARIAEDEAVARAAFRLVGGREVGGWYWSNAGDAVFVDHSEDVVAYGAWPQLIHQPSAHHIARWDPERVVAECAAKRQVVEHGRRRRRTTVLRTSPWSTPSIPDFRDDWRPRSPRLSEGTTSAVRRR